MARIDKIRLLIFSFVFLSGSNVWSQVIYQGRSLINIGNEIEYYIDTFSTQNIQNIQQQTHFIKSAAEVPDFGLLQVPVWVKITISNKTDDENIMIQFDKSLLKTIEFYYKEKNGEFNVNRSGELYPFTSRKIIYHKFIYDLKIPHDSTITYYAKITSSHKMQMPVFLGSKDRIEKGKLSKNIFFGIFFGIFLVMFFYNLFIYFVVKDPIYVYYVIYIFVVGILQSTIEGYSFQYLWPNSNFLATRSFFLLTAMVNITGLEFVRKFLHTKNFIPRFDKFSYLIYVVYAVDIILTVKGDLYTSYHILQSFAGIVSLYILVISIIIALQGYRPAKFFIIAWIPLISGIIIFILQDINIIPYNIFTNYSITFGSALEVVLLSFALADKINIFKKDKEKSQEETLKALQENERIVREQNVILEKNVNERTKELSASNEELNKTLENLKETQTQLVESEKMASLGQLTAGIAHEINNPINFVTSNINPLKRDIDIIIDVLTTIEKLGLSDAAAVDKQKQIDEYKEEVDFDYLKVEISNLLKGINEGAMRTAEIVKGLKIFSRLDEDDLKRADINEGLDSTIIIINNMLNNRIKIIKNYGNVPLIECYAGKLNQVFLNILSNSIYAIQKRFGENAGGEIIISTTNDNDHVVIKIKDNGTGMDTNTQKKIFEPFFTTKEVGEGTGLGMSIAFNTIKKHNGQITVNSIPNEGTEFNLQIPLKFNAKSNN